MDPLLRLRLTLFHKRRSVASAHRDGMKLVRLALVQFLTASGWATLLIGKITRFDTVSQRYMAEFLFTSAPVKPMTENLRPSIFTPL